MPKPLSNTEMEEVVRARFLDPYLDGLRKQYPKIKIETDPGFIKEFTRIFYKATEGARSTRSAVDRKLAGVVTEALIGAGKEIRQGQPVILRLGVSDNYANKFYLENPLPGHAPVERKVILSATTESEGRLLETQQSDLSTDAPKLELMTEEMARQATRHELGHILTNRPEVTKRIPLYVTLEGSGDMLAHVRWKELPSPKMDTRAHRLDDGEYARWPACYEDGRRRPLL